MKTLYKQSFMQKIGSLLSLLILIIPLGFVFFIAIWILNGIGINSDIVFIIVGAIFIIIYLISFIYGVIDMFDNFYVEVYKDKIFIYESKKKQHTFKLDEVSIGYSIKTSDSSAYEGILNFVDSNGEKTKIDCSKLGDFKFKALISQLKLDEQSIKLN